VDGGEAAPKTASTYRLTRALFLRFLGGIYFVAFLSLSEQVLPLFGHDGLLPIEVFVRELSEDRGGAFAAFLELPSLFFVNASDVTLQAGAWIGAAMSLLVVLGFANAIGLAFLWFLYMSYVHVGQVFYGFGWEMLLLETGFLAIFLCPIARLRPDPRSTPPAVVMWLLRWVLFRVMFGAGLIKIRGDSCWRDLTCLYYHYETQPIPNPLSWLLHQMPPWFHKLGVLWNHFIELVVPWSVFVPVSRVAAIGGLLQIAFQISLILSGNLSWLNWLTIAIAISCFDDSALAWLAPRRIRERLWFVGEAQPPSLWATRVAWGLGAVVVLLSFAPTANLLSSHQVMNTSFDRLHLVNTYGAFGSVGRERDEVILQGTSDAKIDEHTVWKEYDFKCKPGDPKRRPCIVSPYHYRVDWEIWFAAMSTYDRHPWLLRLVQKLLANDAKALSLIATNPFPEAPPRFIRAELYRYHFTRIGDGSNAWWKRERTDSYFPPVSAEDLRSAFDD
jgi:hypothetical protein